MSADANRTMTALVAIVAGFGIMLAIGLLVIWSIR